MKRSVVLYLALTSFAIALSPIDFANEDSKPAAAASKPVVKVAIPDGAAEFEGHHYQLYDEVEDLSWTGAKESCASRGGYLVVVHTAEEAEFIAKLCKDR